MDDAHEHDPARLRLAEKDMPADRTGTRSSFRLRPMPGVSASLLAEARSRRMMRRAARGCPWRCNVAQSVSKNPAFGHRLTIPVAAAANDAAPSPQQHAGGRFPTTIAQGSREGARSARLVTVAVEPGPMTVGLRRSGTLRAGWESRGQHTQTAVRSCWPCRSRSWRRSGGLRFPRPSERGAGSACRLSVQDGAPSSGVGLDRGVEVVHRLLFVARFGAELSATIQSP